MMIELPILANKALSMGVSLVSGLQVQVVEQLLQLWKVQEDGWLATISCFKETIGRAPFHVCDNI